MGEFDRLVTLDESVKRILGIVQSLEVGYKLARAEEIALGLKPRHPFLKSRGYLRQIKMHLSKARALQQRYNRKASPTLRVNLVEKIVANESEFEQSRVVMAKLFDKNNMANEARFSEDYLLSETGQLLASYLTEEQREALKGEPLESEISATQAVIENNPQMAMMRKQAETYEQRMKEQTKYALPPDDVVREYDIKISDLLSSLKEDKETDEVKDGKS